MATRTVNTNVLFQLLSLVLELGDDPFVCLETVMLVPLYESDGLFTSLTLNHGQLAFLSMSVNVTKIELFSTLALEQSLLAILLMLEYLFVGEGLAAVFVTAHEL